MCATVKQPVDHFSGFGALCGLDGCQVVPADPVDVGAVTEEVGGGLALSAVAGSPEGAVDLLPRRLRLAGEVLLHLRQQAHGEWNYTFKPAATSRTPEAK